MVKIYAIFCLGLSALIYPGFILGYIIVALLFVAAAVAGLLKKFSKFIFMFFVPIFVMLMFIQGLYSPKNVTVLADFGFAQLGLEGTVYALKIVGTLLTFLGSFYLMSTTTYTGKLVAAQDERDTGSPECQERGDQGNHDVQAEGIHTPIRSGGHVLPDRCPGAGDDAGDQGIRD